MTGRLPEVLLFDVMGTVVDMDGSVRRETCAVLGAVGVDAEQADRFRADVDIDLQRSMDAIIDGRTPWQGHRALREQSWQRVAPTLADETRESLASVVERVEPWPDSSEALRRLRSRCRLVALSNADRDELAALSKHADLPWHVTLSAQQVHSYKPDPAVYVQAISAVSHEPDDIMMVAAHPWDLRAAAGLGLRTAYVRRPDAQAPADDDAFDVEVNDLSELADLFE
jgi:2-haloacid dehalogenase